MKTEEVLILVKAGFTADEIRVLSGMDAESAPELPAAPEEPMTQPAPEHVAQPAPEHVAQPAPEPAHADPSAAPAWFTEFVQKNNEEMAAMQRAFQLTNVRRADAEHTVKTPEQLAAEAFDAIR